MLTVYSSFVCPFAQRTRIHVRLKEIDHEVVEIDLHTPRPAWYLAKNPLGKVPAIEHDGRILYESSVISEYLEDAFPQKPLLPADPHRRALTRLLIALGNERFVPTMYGLLKEQDQAMCGPRTDAALAAWREVDAFLRHVNPDGTWLFDEVGFGLAELNFAGFFERYCLNEHYRGFELPEGAEYTRVRKWRDAILAHPVVKATGLPREDFIKLYFDYSLGYGNAAMPPGRTHSSMDYRAWPLEQRELPPKGTAPAR